jgi:hypothetical protein
MSNPSEGVQNPSGKVSRSKQRFLFYFWDTPCRTRPDSYGWVKTGRLLLNDRAMRQGCS